jgi:glucose-1-phosphate thymidylyltransferase
MGDVVTLLGSGKDYGCRFTYKVQDEPGGIAQALGLAEHHCLGEQLAVILGDNIFTDPLTPFVRAFEKQKTGAKVIIKQVQDPWRFGVPEMQGDRILSIEEKPKHPKSNYAVTGIYFYDATVFEVIKTLKPSGRGELEITDVNNHYIRKGQMTFDKFEGDWTDAGTFESLAYANNVMMDK